ncbi:hypothetical protein ACB092_08G060500 [Castanea dentata]
MGLSSWNLEELGVAADTAMPTATSPAAPTVPISAISITPASAIPIALILTGPIPIAPSQFEVGSSSAMVPDPVSKATAFFTHFN